MLLEESTKDVILQQLSHLSKIASPSSYVEISDTIVNAVRKSPEERVDVPMKLILTSVLPFLADHRTKEERTAAFRLLRYLVVDEKDVEELREVNLDLYLVRTLARDHKFDQEKLQALGLIRTILQLPEGTQHLSPAVIRAVVAIGEHAEDKLRLIALETLSELALRDTDLLSFSGGLRVVLQTLADGPAELTLPMSLLFVYILDTPIYRVYLHPGVDFEIILSGFTSAQGKTISQEDRLRASSKMVAQIIKSWSGLLYLCTNDKEAIYSLVDSLRTPSTPLREAILDTLFDIFGIQPPDWYNSFVSGKRLTLYRQRKRDKNDGHAKKSTTTCPDPQADRSNLLDHYKSLLLLVFIDAGLIEALIGVAEERASTPLSRKVSLLIGELLRYSNRILPLAYGAKVQALPRLFELAANFQSDSSRLVATSALYDVDSFGRNSSRLEPFQVDIRTRSNSLDDPLKRGQRHVENTKLRMGIQIDDNAFKNMVVQAQVLSTKDWTKWSFDTLLDLFEGPLLNPDRLNEAMRASKFVRNVLRFYHPLNYKYSDLKKNKSPYKWTKLGCTILVALLASPDGIRYLAEDKLLRQIADCLAQLDPLTGATPIDAVFTRQRLEHCFASGYFEMIGTLSKYTEGVRLLERFKIFTLFYHLSALNSREDIVKAIVETMDYEHDGHPRVILSKALTSSYKQTRFFATQHLGKLIDEAPDAKDWQIHLLLTQLYDTSTEVCNLAVKILEGACRSLRTLEIVVQLRPSLDHLGDAGAPLLLRFLSNSLGARYLHEIEYIDREIEDWFHDRNHYYVVQLELALAKRLLGDPEDSSPEEFDGHAPPHFYGELVKTAEGRAILRLKGHFSYFATFIREHGLENQDQGLISQLKSVLWAVGHVGATADGLVFLEEEDIIPYIVDIAYESSVYSVRGTAFFVLGLISSTVGGVEALEELEWESVVNSLGHPTGLCIPLDLDRFVYTPLWNSPQYVPPESLHLPQPSDDREREALMAIANLSNHMLANSASKTLSRLKTSHPETFRDPGMYYRSLESLADHHYRLPVRRYILELFDVPIDEAGTTAIMAAGERLRALKIKEGNSRRPTDLLSEHNREKQASKDDNESEKAKSEPILKISGFILS